ncbi:MAG: DUF882 domain-containing protein [Pseudomonadota bacterium]
MDIIESDRKIPTRRRVLAGITALGASSVLGFPALARGAGEFRSFNMVNKRTGEWLKTVYWVEGSYIPEAMDAINTVMRDWRQDEKIQIDRRTIDIISAAHNLLDCQEPFELVSGYRSPTTNAALRRKSRGVARNSYHMRGMAADLKLQTRSVQQIAAAGRALRAGGVGKYSRSSFVHFDSGPVRDWGR